MTSLPFNTSSMRAESSALACEMSRTTISIKIAQNRSLDLDAARGLQVLIQMAQAGELPGKAGRARGTRGAARAEIAAAGGIAPGDHGGAHGTVLVSALRPG